MSIIAYADCPSGVSGDMFLSACLDLGMPLDFLNGELSKVNLSGYEIKVDTVLKQGLSATTLKVIVKDSHHHRNFSDIRQIIQDSSLPSDVKSKSVAVFKRLAVAEGKIHGLDPGEVSFHEVGAVDSIVDIIGAAIGIKYHKITNIYASHIPTGQGWIKSAHGRLPIPAPATMALLENIPTYGTGLKFELVTPTGAAILAENVIKFGPLPAMTIIKTGYGAGSRNLPDRPNIFRLTLGRAETELGLETLNVTEANLDDMNPEFWPNIMEKLFSEGALDVWLTPIQMKKGRPAVKLSVLSRLTDTKNLAALIFEESTTLGVRTYSVDRLALKRETRQVETPWGQMRVKAVFRSSRTELVPEYEDCLKAAKESGLPLKEIYAKVLKLAENSQ